jgi:hypothetical protein
MGRIFDQGVRKRGPILIWGYAERNNFDLGVRKYQKVENPCFRRIAVGALYLDIFWTISLSLFTKPKLASFSDTWKLKLAIKNVIRR